MEPGELSAETRSRERRFLRFVRIFSRELADSLYRGLLARPSDAAGLAAYSKNIQQATRLADVVGDMARSDEFRKRMFSEQADMLVRGVFRGALGREPDGNARDSYGRMISERCDVAELIATVVGSAEFRKRLLSEFLAALAQPVYKGLQGRAPSATELLDYTAMMRQPNDLEHVLRKIVKSSEFSRKRTEDSNVPDPKNRFEVPTLVFLHMHRTGGSSLNRLLALSYGHRNICFRGSNRIYKAPAGLLSRSTVFAGHLNYDSLSYIPRKSLSIVGMVREPRGRLLSLYHYWRAHEPTHADYSEGSQLANELSLVAFLQDPRISTRPEVWNHMTWALMGERQWSEWRHRLAADPADERVLREARALIAGRLRGMLFVGLQERFAESVELLFHALGRSKPSELPQLNSLGDRMVSDPHFKKALPAEGVGVEAERVLERVLQLDLALYDEAHKLFEERYSSWRAQLPFDPAIQRIRA